MERYFPEFRGTIRATVPMETIRAAFEMDQIVHELREHSAGLNCGRWDYIFSFIKKFRNRPGFVLPLRFPKTRGLLASAVKITQKKMAGSPPQSFSNL